MPDGAFLVGGLAMRDSRMGVLALALSGLTVVTTVIATAAGRTGQENPPAQIPRTWDDQAIATLQAPLCDASSSPVPVSADYYYRIPVRPIYKIYPVYQ